jgi:exopolysaccharide biosynthesis polyprenyl glycosylphosphotransferase
LNSLENAIRDCETEGVVVTITIDLFDMNLANSSVTELDGTPLLHFKTTVGKEWELFLKRTLDILFSGVTLLVLSPFLAVTALLVKLTSPGPVFFRQERLGLNGRRFRLIKFRTMQQGAHDELSNVSDLSEMDTPEFQKKKIGWITPLGRIMRKFSIDEFPQLINVFLGQMSLVGPRPTVPDEVRKYKTWQRRRLSMKPGITCLWQVKGRNKIGFEEWMKLDLEYLDNWSLWLDFKILVRTIPVVIFGIGAY